MAGKEAYSVEKASAYNKENIAAGRCVCMQGDVSSLPFQAEQFDLATAFETIYFWPGLENCFAEVCRVLKPGGAFLIVNESDGRDPISHKYEKIIDGMIVYTKEQIEDALMAAGFSTTMSDQKKRLPWISVIAEK